jgi:FkbM family methyltransferase
MITLCKRIYRIYFLLKKTRSPRLLLLLSKFRELDFYRIEVSSEAKVMIKGTNVDLSPSSRHFLLEGFSLLVYLLDCCKAELTQDKDGRVLMRVKQVSFYLKSWQELFIAHEIFVCGCYNVFLEEPFYLIDIGFNVGLASLFFASQDNCLGIQAFEPFPQTIKHGSMNIGLNPSLKKKISLHKYGLAGADRKLILEYCPELKGSIGLGGISPFAKPKGFAEKVSRVEIQVKDAAKELKKRLHDKTSEKIICKMDCEGSEYEILPRLDSENCLKFVDVYLVEWHLDGPKHLEEIFIKNGFNCLSLNPVSDTHGMLYAFK